MLLSSKIAVFLLLATTLFSCARADTILFPENPDLRTVQVYMVSHGWHVGIALPIDSTFLSAMPESIHARDYNWAEVGWGDRDFYTQQQRGFWGKFKGALWPTKSTVHISAFNLSVEQMFSGQDVIEIRLSPNGYAKLLEFLDSTLKKNQDNQPVRLMDGLYGSSVFYASDRRYFFPRTSNTWAVRLLKEAGAPVRSWSAISSGSAMRQAARIEQ